MTINKNLLCVKWDEFNNFVLTGLSNLYQRDEMADVTLYCDGRSFKAHKTILSIWSPYFKEIFASTTHPHPVIILQETGVSDLELILRFIYHGQLFVPYEDADRFLRTAEHFQIAGLKNMRVNPLSSQQTQVNGHVPHAAGGGGLASNVPSDLSTTSSCSRAQPLQSTQFGPAAGTSFTPIVINNGSTSLSPGVSYRISSNDLPLPSSFQQQPSHSAVNSSSYPTEIARPIQSSSNVIKSHPRIIQHESTQLRPPSPSLIGQTSLTIQSQAFQPLPQRNDIVSKQSADRVVYQTNPQSVLIVHSPNTSHNGYQSLKDSQMIGKQSETVVVLENVASSAIHGTNSVNTGCNSYTVYNNHLGTTQTHVLNPSEDEEVLGLNYMQDTNRSHHQHGPHSQMIQDAAIAAGVDVDDHDTANSGTIQYPSPTHSTAVTKSNINRDEGVTILSTSNPTTPVYAVKRQVTLTNETFRASSSSKPSTSSSVREKVKILKGKHKKDPVTKVQAIKKDEQDSSSSTEFTNCPKCKKSVKKSSLKVHMKRTHLDEGTILTCPICDKQIRSKGVYYKHMYLHRQKVPEHDDSGKFQLNTRSRSSNSK